MKKIFSLLLVFLPFFLFAEEVGPAKARSVAEQFLKEQLPSTRAADLSLQLVWNGETPLAGNRTLIQRSSAPDSAPAFYIFNNIAGGGYVIVSGDDRTMPVLAWSATEVVPIQSMPSNFLGWLDFLRREVNHARTSGVQASPSVKTLWEHPSRAGKEGRVVVQHQTATWDQGAPFWDECPLYRGRRTYSGCVITAVATVMKFHRWPDSSVGRAPAYTTATYGIDMPARQLGHTYHWDKMPMNYYTPTGRENYTAEEGAEVAQLMADLGAILQADYGDDHVGGTGAFSTDIPRALATYMKYDQGIWCGSRDYYAYPEWLEMMQNELDRCPVIYGGSSKEGGHSFVIDGYTDRDYFHVNWGWNGMSDGWFLLSALDPDQQGAGGSDSAFDTYQDAIFGMRKDEGGKAVEQLIILPYSDPEQGFDYSGFHASVQQIRKDTPFKLTLGVIINGGFKEFDCDMMMANVGMDGKIKESLYEESFKGPDNIQEGYIYAFDDVDITIRKAIEAGDRIKLFYRTARTKDWVPALGAAMDGCVYELPLTQEGADPAWAHDITLDYRKTSRQLELTVPDGVGFRLEDCRGKSLECVSQDGRKYKVNGKELPSGSYYLVFQKGKTIKEMIVKF